MNVEQFISSAIRFVPSDTPPASVYRLLAGAIVRHRAGHREFQPI